VDIVDPDLVKDLVSLDCPWQPAKAAMKESYLLIEGGEDVL
jgi:hypothetical protein